MKRSGIKRWLVIVCLHVFRRNNTDDKTGMQTLYFPDPIDISRPLREIPDRFPALSCQNWIPYLFPISRPRGNPVHNWPFVRGSPGHQWFPSQRASDAELWCFFDVNVKNCWISIREKGELNVLRVIWHPCNNIKIKRLWSPHLPQGLSV